MELPLASGLITVLILRLPHFSLEFKNLLLLNFAIFQDVQTSSMIVMFLYHDLSPNSHSNQLVFEADFKGYSTYFLWLVSFIYLSFDLAFRNQ